MAERSENKLTHQDEIPAGSRPEWLWGLGLVVAVVLTYLPVWHAGYFWDDIGYVITNPCVVGPLGFKEIWTTKEADICPLVITTFWAEHAFWGLDPRPYHVVNVLLHAAGAVVLWRLLLALRVPGAWLGATLWALHPLQVETVAWITETKNTESGVFYLFSILFFVKALQTQEMERLSGVRWNYAVMLLFAAMAMAAKSSTVVLPGVLCLCAWLVEDRWRWRNLIRVAPVVLLSIAACLVTLWTQKLRLEAVADPLGKRTWPERFATAGDAVWFYLGKLLWPHPLMSVYPRWNINAAQLTTYLPLLAFLVGLLILWLKRQAWGRFWFLTFAYFVTALLPVLGFADHYFLRYSFVGDHFQYLAGIGPIALVGAGLARYQGTVFPAPSRWPCVVAAALLLVCAVLSWQRACTYKSEETMWTDTVVKNPRCWVGYVNLGDAFLYQGQVDKAVVLYQTALAINPDYVEAHSNLGNAYRHLGRLDEALQQYRQALVLNPNHPITHYNLGLLLLDQGQTDQGIAEFQKAVALNPTYAEAYNSLGNAYLHKGQVDDAISAYQKAIATGSNYAEAHYNLGVTLGQNGRVDEAMTEYQQALALGLNNPGVHNNYGTALLGQKRIDEAVGEFQQALALDPTFADAHTNLAIALGEKGRLDEALAQFQEAARLRPDDQNAQNNLAKARAMVEAIKKRTR